ncbi:hypothetical protein FACS189435_4180 [Bacteroidia bacterium]|nr:hypothetical protein FACS189435_4180 [Bacteroidia bacterium]
MFVRKKKNRSGTSVVIVSKCNGKTNYVKTTGSSSNVAGIEKLYQQGKNWLSAYLGERDMFAEHTREQEEKQATGHLLGNIGNILPNGTQLILNHVFKRVGFDKIDDDILKHLVVSRICQPRSKVATVDYLKPYFDEDIELHKIYRYLDKLHDSQRIPSSKSALRIPVEFQEGKSGLSFTMQPRFILKLILVAACAKQDFPKTGNTLNHR